MTQEHIYSNTQHLANKLSRRYALGWLGTGGLSTALVIGSDNIAESHPKDRFNNTPQIVQAWANAQNAHDPTAHARLYTDNGILEDVPNGFRIQGRGNIQCFLESVQRIFGDIKVELENAKADRNWALAEYWFSATNEGFIPIPSTIGKRFRVRTTTIFSLNKGKIQRSSDYYDNAAILAQFGLIAPPPAASVPIGCNG